MNTLKEIEEVKIFSEAIYQKNLWYPYTIKKVLDSGFYKKRLKENQNDLDYIIYKLEQFCHCLMEYPQVNRFNLSQVVFSLLKNNDSFICMSEKEINKKIIQKELNKIDFAIINDEIQERMIIDTKSHKDKDVDFKDPEELEKIILNLINTYNFPYSDILTKFFLELNLADIFKFRNDYKSKNIKRTEIGLMNLLNHLNYLIYILDATFEKDDLFIFRMLELYLFSKNELKDYFIYCLSFDNSNFMKASENISERNIGILLKGFSDGMLHIKECYFVEFSKFDNSEFGTFRNSTKQYRYDCLKDFCSKLDNKSIYTIYSISHIEKDIETLDYIKELDDLAKDVKAKKKKILMTKQELTEKQRTLILDIMDKIKYDSNKFKDITLNNLYQVGRMITFLSFKICIESHDYDVKITKNNRDLVWHVKDNNEKFIREVCVCVADVERIISLIYRHIEETKLKIEYNLS